MVELTEMDLIRSALYNAYFSGLSLHEVCLMSNNAETIEDFDHAVNVLGLTVDYNAVWSELKEK